jgi:hypothetical protein
VLEEKGLRNYGTDPTRSEQAGHGGDQVDKKNDQIAHRRMVAGQGIQGITGETTIRQPQVCATSNIGGKSATSRQDWLRQFCPLALPGPRATMTVVHRVTAAELLQCA